MYNISIIVPVYNVEKYIEDCLNSILNQNTEFKIEVIIINDGSTDNSMDIIYSYENKFKKFIIIEQENKGLSNARNTGLKAASGEYILFLDSDDYIDLNCVDTSYRMCKINNLDKLSFGLRWCYEYEYGYECEEHTQDFSSIVGNIYTGEDLYNEISKIGHFTESACTCMYRKDFLKENGLYFNENILYEDVLFSIEAILKCKRAMHISDKLYSYRVREESIMTSVPTAQNIESYIYISYGLIRILNENSFNIKITTIENLLDRICKLFEIEILGIYNKLNFNFKEKYNIKLKILDSMDNIERGIINKRYSDSISLYKKYIQRIKAIKMNLIRL